MKVTEAVPELTDVFGFEKFNRMQCEMLSAILDTGHNVVTSAPTASGKTALAEPAIYRTLRDEGTALFIAPFRVLTTEKKIEWECFEDFGRSVYVVTGERNLNPRWAVRADVFVMTPEKIDSAIREHDPARHSFIGDADYVVIGEVHPLGSETRSGASEVTVLRIRRTCDPRIAVLPVIMPDTGDVAMWLDASDEAIFGFGDDYRPVDLRAGVKTYTHGGSSLTDKYHRLYRVSSLTGPHIRDGDQPSVFVPLRQNAVRAAVKARNELAKRDMLIGACGNYDFHNEARELSSDSLAKGVSDGVGFHHAGLSQDDRKVIEGWFKEDKIQLLLSTFALTQDVNLPVRCVVIRDMKYHNPFEDEVDISPFDVPQMLGRADRPGYDNVGYNWVVCNRLDRNKCRRLFHEGKEIESHLTEDLGSHLNAEIAMETIRDLDDVVSWSETAFYYRRA